MQSRFNFRSPLSLFLTGLLLYLVFGLLWWNGVYTGPRKTFEDMLANNLSVADVTKNEFITSHQTTNLQRVSLQLGHDNIARWLVMLKSSNASVTTETIGTKGVGYVRYIDINDGTKHDYSKIENVWAKSGNDQQSAELLQLFSQSLIDVTAAPVPPIGNLAADKRAELVNYMKDEAVFTPDYKTVKRDTINGRAVYVYDVSVKLAPYVRVMQSFAHVYGLKDLDSVNASDYQSQQPAKVSIAVDKLSHQMVRVSSNSNGFSETYTDYGVDHHFTLPKATISSQELQAKLQAAK